MEHLDVFVDNIKLEYGVKSMHDWLHVLFYWTYTCIRHWYILYALYNSQTDKTRLRIHQRLFNVEISFASNSFITKENIIKVNIIRKLIKFNILLSLFQPQWEIDQKVIITDVDLSASTSKLL